MLQNSAGAVRLSRFDREQGGGSAISRRAPALTSFALEVEEVPTGTCPECDADVHVDLDTDKGDIVSCEECGTDLEVVGLDPVELDIVEEEDLDEEEDEDEF